MKKLHFLAVDDEPINLNIIKAILEAEGHEVLTMTSGLEALKHCRAGDSAFDLILLDVHMPHLNGLETALCLRGIEETRTTPIIFVSARAAQADQEAGLAAGGQYYLTKPFRRKDLLDAVAQILPGSNPAAS